MEDLFQKTGDMHIQVTPSDVAILVESQIDKETLQRIIRTTVPVSDDIDVLYSQRNLDCK